MRSSVTHAFPALETRKLDSLGPQIRSRTTNRDHQRVKLVLDTLWEKWVELAVAKIGGAHHGKNGWNSLWQKLVEFIMAKMGGTSFRKTVAKMGGTHCGKNGKRSPWQKRVKLVLETPWQKWVELAVAKMG